MAAFMVSPFGLFVMGLFAELFTTPSEQTFTVLAYGWAVASGERQTITTYLWLTGATSVKHFSCCYRFLGGALYQARWQVWARIIRGAAQRVPAGAVSVVGVDESAKEKAGGARWTRRRKGGGGRLKGWPIIVRGQAPPAKNVARCGGATLCGGRCVSPYPAGRARG